MQGNVEPLEQCFTLIPADYSPAGINYTFPKIWWLPGTGTQRGTVALGDRDPLTPMLPAIDGIYRLNRNETNTLARIPAQVITYNDAVEFLKRLGGKSFHYINWNAL